LISLLDTDVVSQRTKIVPNPKAMSWLRQLSERDAYLSVVTIQEIRAGIDLLDAGRMRRDLDVWLEKDVRGRYAGRIFPVTEEIAEVAGRFVAQLKRRAKSPDANDMFIAATAHVHGLRLATLNKSHFEDLDIQLVVF
jgi:predicted nucleic acid-binding protein